MTDDFYRAFEDRYRGSRELIKSRLRVYLPFVEPLKQLYPSCTGVDLGCGRGEWLELMTECGIDARGVDLDEGMLTACRERGLAAEKADAIDYLRGLPDASVAVVSGFHVAEHIPFEALQELVQQALRVLMPAGLLILETPNPENLSVGTSSFYLDPTHQKPIPPSLLSFLPEYYGFARTKIVRLQEEPRLIEARELGLSDVLSGVSPDYAVVAQKGGLATEDLALFDVGFGKDYGVDLDTLAMRYDAHVGSELAEILARVDRSAEVEAQARADLAARDAEIQRLREQMTQAEAQARADLAARDAELADLYASTSWRVTAPMRAVAVSSRRLAKAPSRMILRVKVWLKPRLASLATRRSVREFGVKAARWTLAHPSLAKPVRSYIAKHPRLERRLRWLLLGQASPAPQPPAGYVPVRSHAVAPIRGRIKQPLRGTAADVDELMQRIEDELASWRDAAQD